MEEAAGLFDNPYTRMIGSLSFIRSCSDSGEPLAIFAIWEGKGKVHFTLETKVVKSQPLIVEGGAGSEIDFHDRYHTTL